jgi:hypothetical protein
MGPKPIDKKPDPKAVVNNKSKSPEKGKTPVVKNDPKANVKTDPKALTKSDPKVVVKNDPKAIV